MKQIQITIRIALSLALIYFIYQETGPATAIFAGLMLVVSEITSKYMTVTNSNLKGIIHLIEGKKL